MFEPTNIPAEIIALTALGNSTLGPGAQTRIKPADFRHVSCASFIEWPPVGGSSVFGGPIVPNGGIFLLTYFSFYTAVEPAVNGTLSVNFGMGFNSIAVSVNFVLSSQVNPIAAVNSGVQAITNRPLIFVFPSLSTPRIVFTESAADPRTDLTIGMYGNLHGYFLPAGYQPIFQQFQTNLKAAGT